MCKGCNAEPIHGPCYSCMTCPDYYLCEDCNLKQIHKEHEMFQVVVKNTKLKGGNEKYVNDTAELYFYLFAVS